MVLIAGRSLGPYEIVAPLGAGGMGEVYRARDTRLGREVAIKVLPQHLIENGEAKQRFGREAHAISALNHPHICTLYDVGDQDGLDFLVMEFLEGETLGKRLERGPLATMELLRIAIEVADGLEKAHRQRILHRDLKPSNIMLTKAGAKLMDFGLAKGVGTGAEAMSSLTHSLNASARDTPVTATGTIVGTFQYMAPEVVEGKEADSQSDIFSLGAVLFEMATGKRAFEGKTAASVIAAILEREPPAISQSQPMSPPALDRLVKTCLAKDPGERVQSAHDVKLQLEWMRDAGSQAGMAAPLVAHRKNRERIAWGTALLLAAVTIFLGLVYFARVPQPAQMMRSSLLPPEGVTFNSFNFDVSPDGTRLAFVATDANGKKTLWVRALSSAGAQQLNGTEDASYPFWAPDSRRIGFFAGGKLKTADISSGTVQVLTDAVAGRGGTWNGDGVIVFAPAIFGPLYRISENGGAAVAVTQEPRKGSGQAHRWPSFLPDGKHFLYFADWSTPEDKPGNGVYAGSLDGGAGKLISSELSGDVVYASGNLLYVKDRNLMAQPFDTGRLETTGPAIIAEQGTPTDMGFSKSGFTVSRNGTLVFESLSDSSSVLTWCDATGKESETANLLISGYGEPRLSPDDRFLAYDSDDDHNGKSYIRVYDLKRGISNRLTDGGNEADAAWSRDGKSITYIGGIIGGTHMGGIYEVSTDGSTRPRVVLNGTSLRLLDRASDGLLVFSNFDRGFPRLEAYSYVDRQVVDFATRGAEPRFSPDGKWIAYAGISIRRFRGAGARIQVSNEVDSQPVWSRDGRHIFFISQDKKMMEADFDSAKGTVSAPRTLFQTRIIAPDYTGTQYDVTADGKFVINSLSANHASPLTLVTNWTALLKKE